MKYLHKCMNILCKPNKTTVLRSRSFSTPLKNNTGNDVSINEEIKLVSTFMNRNRRSLERLALANKDMGWGLTGNHLARNYPRRNYYHRLCLERTCGHTYAFIEHYLGDKVIEVSTRDWLVRKHLYKGNDVSASAILGSILVELCIRSGISCAAWIPHTTDTSEATKLFLQEFTDAGFSLEEPDEVLYIEKWRYHRKRGPAPPSIV